MFDPDILFVGDLHIHERAEFSAPIGENPRLLDGLSILDQIVSVVKENDIQAVIFTGDLFELKDKIPNHILVPFAQRIEKILGFGAEVLALRGNHDFKIPEYSTTGIFPSIMNINDVYTYTTARNQRKIGFIPYYRDQKEFQEKWIGYHNRGVIPDVIVFHNELPGVYYSKKMKAPSDWDFPTFEKTLYIGGHIHQPQYVKSKNNNIFFIGTPYQIDFDDPGTKTNYAAMVYDSNLNRLGPCEFAYPRFVEIDLNKADSLITRTNGNYVRIIGTVQPQDRSKVKEIKENLLSRGAKAVQLKVKYLTENISRIKAEKTDYRGVIGQYLRGTITDLDKERLMNTGLYLLEKVK